MTVEQAEAILLAEVVLQDVGMDGPDSAPGSAWNDYVQEAGRTLKADPLYCNSFNGLHLLEGCDD